MGARACNSIFLSPKNLSPSIQPDRQPSVSSLRSSLFCQLTITSFARPAQSLFIFIFLCLGTQIFDHKRARENQVPRLKLIVWAISFRFLLLLLLLHRVFAKEKEITIWRSLALLLPLYLAAGRPADLLVCKLCFSASVVCAQCGWRSIDQQQASDWISRRAHCARSSSCKWLDRSASARALLVAGAESNTRAD